MSILGRFRRALERTRWTVVLAATRATLVDNSCPTSPPQRATERRQITVLRLVPDPARLAVALHGLRRSHETHDVHVRPSASGMGRSAQKTSVPADRVTDREGRLYSLRLVSRWPRAPSRCALADLRHRIIFRSTKSRMARSMTAGAPDRISADPSCGDWTRGDSRAGDASACRTGASCGGPCFGAWRSPAHPVVSGP